MCHWQMKLIEILVSLTEKLDFVDFCCNWAFTESMLLACLAFSQPFQKQQFDLCCKLGFTSRVSFS